MSTRITRLYDNFRDQMLQIPYLTSAPAAGLGFTAVDLVRAYSTNRDTGNAPGIALWRDAEGRDPILGIDHMQLFMGVYTRNALMSETGALSLVDRFHKYQITLPGLIVYKCFHVEGPLEPIQNPDTQFWEAVVKFDLLIGG